MPEKLNHTRLHPILKLYMSNDSQRVGSVQAFAFHALASSLDTALHLQNEDLSPRIIKFTDDAGRVHFKPASVQSKQA